MILSQQPKKEIVINEIIIMRDLHHKNIVNFIDSYLGMETLWVKQKKKDYSSNDRTWISKFRLLWNL